MRWQLATVALVSVVQSRDIYCFNYVFIVPYTPDITTVLSSSLEFDSGRGCICIAPQAVSSPKEYPAGPDSLASHLIILIYQKKNERNYEARLIKAKRFSRYVCIFLAFMGLPIKYPWAKSH